MFKLQAIWRRYGERFFMAMGLCAVCGLAPTAAETADIHDTPAPAIAPERLPRLVLAGPGAVVTYPLLHMIETEALKDYADKVEFRLWQNADQLRVLLAKQEIDYSAAPSNLLALMFNRGDPDKPASTPEKVAMLLHERLTEHAFLVS